MVKIKGSFAKSMVKNKLNNDYNWFYANRKQWCIVDTIVIL